uniref:Cell division cycle protein 123 homolog n=1 Tax=Ananas comosus var. bracteatus TaxID=296719 RepID=A0A6V7Q5F9_ANACO|nr:unnamed protein product [Ananas comosus var. bracteatus]
MLVEELLRCQIREWYPIFKTHTFPTLFVPLPLPFRRYLLGLPPLNPNPNPINTINAINDHDDDDAPPPPLFLLPRSSTPLPRPSLPPSTPSPSSTPPFPPPTAATTTMGMATRRRSRSSRRRWSAASRSSAAPRSPSSTGAPPRTPRGSPPTGPSAARPLAPPGDGVPLLRPPPPPRRRLPARRHRLLPALLDRRRDILAAIRSFFDGVVAPRFASQDYTVDVYVMRDMRVKIVDFNPWGAFTLPLLFTWEELEEMKETEEVEIRVLESQCGVRPGLKTAVPYDYLDTGEGSGWDQFLRNAEEEIRRQTRNSQNSDAAAGDY